MTLHIQINLNADVDGKFNPIEQAVLAALSGGTLDKGGKLPDAPLVKVAAPAPAAEAEAPKPAPKAAPAKRAVKAAPAPKPSTGPAVLEEDPTDTDDKMDADAREAHEAAAAAEADPTDGAVEEPTVTYDDVLARATALAAKSKQPEIKKVLSSIGGFSKVRELQDVDESVLKAFMNGLAAL